MSQRLVPLLAAALLASCGEPVEPHQPPPAADAEPRLGDMPPSYSHDAAFDASGYFLPTRPVQSGAYRLRHIEVGRPSDFAAFETGRAPVAFGPLTFVFDDVTSPIVANEIGERVHAVTARVTPASYRFNPEGMSYQGADPTVGLTVRFQGTFTPAADAVLAARRHSKTPVLTGLLQLGSGPARQTAFTYYEGD